MIRFLISICVVAIFAIPAEAQLFPRWQSVVPAFRQSNCPGGVCASPQQIQTFSPVVRTPIIQRVPTITLQPRPVVVRSVPIFSSVRVSQAYSVPVFSVPVVESGEASVLMGAVGDRRDRLALRLALIKQTMTGNGSARTILNNPAMFDAMLETLQADHAEGVRSGAVTGKATDFFEWLFEHQDQIKSLIEMIIALFASHGIDIPAGVA